MFKCKRQIKLAQKLYFKSKLQIIDLTPTVKTFDRFNCRIWIKLIVYTTYKCNLRQILIIKKNTFSKN